MKRIRLGKFLISCMMILTMIVPAAMVSVPVSAGSVKVIYGKKTHTHSKTKSYLYINGKKKNVAHTPIFSKSGAYVGPAGAIFKDTLKLNYKAKGNKLTIKYKSNKLEMTSGSWYAKLNGKKTKLGAQTWVMTYKANKKKRWVIPLNSVCKRLGLNYKLSNGVIYINTPEASSTEDAAPEVTTTAAKTTTTASPTVSGRKIVIVVDAGHGGSDSGATGNGLREKDMTLAIVKAAKTYFDKDSHFQVYYTRLTDVYPTLSQRSTFANNKKADLFLCVHINSAGSSATGTETLYNPNRNNTTKNKSLNITSTELATYCHNGALKATGLRNRGLKVRTDLHVLNKTNMPACLIEYGFISNKKEAAMMNANTAKFGKALYQSTVDLMKKKGVYK